MDRRLREPKKEEKEEADDVTWDDARKRNETTPRMGMARQPYPDRSPPKACCNLAKDQGSCPAAWAVKCH